jgi:hypothetical protein
VDGPQHFQVLSNEPVAVVLDESLSGYVNDIGQFPQWSLHLPVSLLLEGQ